MKRVLLMLSILFLFSYTLFGQVQRVVLLEEATNASCGPCAANNPALQEFFSKNFGNIISIRYHASWPGYDPMYSHNTVENSARISYYSITGVPNYCIDGSRRGVPGDIPVMTEEMDARLAISTPLEIQVNHEIRNDSLIAHVKLIAHGPVAAASMKLRIAVIERMIRYATPPGGNGETEFADVMRKMLPNQNGTVLSEMAAGTELEFELGVPVHASWDPGDLAVVAFVQSDATKEVIQSNISVATYFAEVNGVPAGIVQKNSSFTKEFKVKNTYHRGINVRLSAGSADLPAGWNATVTVDNVQHDSLDVALAPGDSIVYGVTVTTDETAGELELGVFAKNLDIPEDYYAQKGYLLLIVSKENVLLVDHDGGEIYENSYKTILNNIGEEYNYIEAEYLPDMADGIVEFGNFKAVVWFDADAYPALTEDDVYFLTSYLDAGGNLLICGQDIGWDIFDPDGESGFPEAEDFYHFYLGAEYIEDNSAVFSVSGVPGDTISDGITFNLGSVYTRYPEVISRYDDNTGIEIFSYNNTSPTKYGAVRNEGDLFRTVYLGFGLEQINLSTPRQTLLTRVLQWFESPFTGNDENSGNTLPTDFSLEQNFPNPFNPSTTIRFSLPSESNVTLKVFDVLGAEVASLVDGKLAAGNHEMHFNAARFGSGVYFYELRAGDFVSMKKMILMK